MAAPPTGTISFTAERKTVQQVDADPVGPSAGDATYIGGQIVSGDVSGFTSAHCVDVTDLNGGIVQCEVDLILDGGTLLTQGTSTSDSPQVLLAVVGGTGDYGGASGSGTLRPTQTGSRVKLRLG